MFFKETYQKINPVEKLTLTLFRSPSDPGGQVFVLLWAESESESVKRRNSEGCQYQRFCNAICVPSQ